MTARAYDPVTEARKYLFVREAGQNRGQRVEAIQKWSGGSAGDSWCCEFATMVYDICYQGKSEIPRTGSCDVVLALAKDRGWTVADPRPGDLVLSVRSPDDAHHIGIVTQANPLTAIAGNTSADGASSNGDRVAEHAISRDNKVFVRVPA
ncbi:MAG TPA: hypothetical protein VIR54_05190 [Vicinamibacterales bacterium]